MWFLELSGFTNVAFGMDVGFEAECGKIAVYAVKKDRMAYLLETSLGSGLSVSRDALLSSLPRGSKKPENETTVSILGLSNKRFQFGDEDFNHLEYHFLSGRSHEVTVTTHELEDLAARVAKVIGLELDRFTAALREELSGGHHGLLVLSTKDEVGRTVPVRSFPYARGLVGRHDGYVCLLRDFTEFSFLEQATFGVPCAAVGYLVLALFSLILKRTRSDALRKHKTILGEILRAMFENSVWTLDPVGFGITFMLLYNYFTFHDVKSAMFFIRIPLIQVLEHFRDKSDRAVENFLDLAPALRGRLSAPALRGRLYTDQTPEGYLERVRRGGHGLGTIFNLESDKILIEFRALHKVLKKHLTIRRTDAAGAVAVDGAEI